MHALAAQLGLPALLGPGGPAAGPGRHASPGHLSGYLPGQSGYNRLLRAAAGLITTLIRLLAADTGLWTDDVWVIDSTPAECGRSRDTAHRSDLAGWAEYGYCASPRADRRQSRPTPDPARHAGHRPGPGHHRPGQTLIADRNYYGTEFEAALATQQLQRIPALTAAIWHNDHTGAPVHRSLTAYDH